VPYRFALERPDYSDFAAGRVLHSLPGRTAFPVRLASEIFQRCLALRRKVGDSGPCVLYDPCCGSAYLLSTLAYLHWESLARVVGSDVDPDVLPLAERNLALLTPSGVDRRIAQLAAMQAAYGKTSHAEAVGSAQRLKSRLPAASTHPIATRVFQADAMDGAALLRTLGPGSVDIVVTDVPYGQRSEWRIAGTTATPSRSPTWRLLQALLPLLSAHAVVAIATDKQQKVAHDAYRRTEHFQIGKRRIVLLTPLTPAWSLP
jgi:hypothetical protein